MTKNKRRRHLAPKSASSRNAYKKRKEGSRVWGRYQVRLDEMKHESDCINER